jgi:hypothetical protein
VIASSLAVFLAVLTLLAAQLHSGLDPVLGSGKAPAALTAGRHSGTVVTRTSGGAPTGQAAPGGAAVPTPVTTRSSAATGEAEDD